MAWFLLTIYIKKWQERDKLREYLLNKKKIGLDDLGNSHSIQMAKYTKIKRYLLKEWHREKVECVTSMTFCWNLQKLKKSEYSVTQSLFFSKTWQPLGSLRGLEVKEVNNLKYENDLMYHYWLGDGVTMWQGICTSFRSPMHAHSATSAGAKDREKSSQR